MLTPYFHKKKKIYIYPIFDWSDKGGDGRRWKRKNIIFHCLIVVKSQRITIKIDGVSIESIIYFPLKLERKYEKKMEIRINKQIKAKTKLSILFLSFYF